MNLVRRILSRFRPSQPVRPYTVGYGLSAVLMTVDPTVNFDGLNSVPPKAPATTGGPSVMPWAEWQNAINHHPIYDGWTFCKFGVRGPGTDDLALNIGIVRAGAAIYQCEFFVVTKPENVQSHEYLAVTVGARTGFALGIFANMDLAVEACEIALRMRCPLDRTPDEAKLEYQRLGTALDALGFVSGAAVCRPIHNGQVIAGPPIPVWTKLEATRPAEVPLS